MRRATEAGALVLSALLIAGCAVAKGSMTTVGEKAFAFSEIDKIRVGMPEAEVVGLLGKPTAFGVDEQGREYVVYDRTVLAMSSTAAIAPTVAGVSGSQRTTGFEVRIHLKDGVVEGVGYTRYGEPEKRRGAKEETGWAVTRSGNPRVCWTC